MGVLQKHMFNAGQDLSSTSQEISVPIPNGSLSEIQEAQQYFFPNKMGRIILLSIEDVMGRNGANAILNLARLQKYIGNYPPNNFAKEFPFENVGQLLQALDEMYGPRGGRAGLIQELYYNHFADAAFGSVDNAAAMQMAVWEIVYEGNLDNYDPSGGVDVDEICDLANVNTDEFLLSGALVARGIANSWLAELTATYSEDARLLGFGSWPATRSRTKLL